MKEWKCHTYLFPCLLTCLAALSAVSFTVFGMGKLPDNLYPEEEEALRFSTRKVTYYESVPMKFVKWYDPALSAESEEMIYDGVAGKELVVVEEFVSDGVVVHSREISRKLVQEGTPGAKRTGSREDTLGTVYRMEATAYHPSDGDGLGITATGTKAGYGTVAVDPDVIELGSSVYVPGYGMAVAADTGGAIIGNRIDLCMEEFDECWEFGRRDIDVFVLGK